MQGATKISHLKGKTANMTHLPYNLIKSKYFRESEWELGLVKTDKICSWQMPYNICRKETFCLSYKKSINLQSLFPKFSSNWDQKQSKKTSNHQSKTLAFPSLTLLHLYFYSRSTRKLWQGLDASANPLKCGLLDHKNAQYRLRQLCEHPSPPCSETVETLSPQHDSVNAYEPSCFVCTVLCLCWSECSPTITAFSESQLQPRCSSIMWGRNNVSSSLAPQ